MQDCVFLFPPQPIETAAATNNTAEEEEEEEEEEDKIEKEAEVRMEDT